MTPAEARFWTMVKGSRVEGRKFRRQHGVGPFILDFYCPAERLAVELDGEVHFSDASREYDRERKLFLNHFGILVLSFENRLIFDDPEWVLANIRHRFGWWRIIQEGPDGK
jgi:very-short-patch-repair endonuclease